MLKTIFFFLLINSFFGALAQEPILADSGIAASEAFNKKSRIPGKVKNYIHETTGYKFSIVNPGRKFQETDDVGLFLKPARRLILGLNSADFIVLLYEHGGRGYHNDCIIFFITKEHITGMFSFYAPLDVDTTEELKLLLKTINSNTPDSKGHI